MRQHGRFLEVIVRLSRGQRWTCARRKERRVNLHRAQRFDEQPLFDHAVAVLHSFFYEESLPEFIAIAKRDPGCAMAWWGVAMSLWHPLWEPPDKESLRRGREAIQRADSIGAGSERERGYIAALATFYRDSDRVDHRTRAGAYERAMEELHHSGRARAIGVCPRFFSNVGFLGSMSGGDAGIRGNMIAALALRSLNNQANYAVIGP